MSKRIVLYTLIPKGFLCGNLRKFKIFFVMHLSMPCPGGEQGGGGIFARVIDIKGSGSFDNAS